MADPQFDPTAPYAPASGAKFDPSASYAPAAAVAPAPPKLNVGAPPNPTDLAKTMTSGEGPIAQGLTSMETRLSNMTPPAAPAAAGAGSYGSAISLAHPEMAAAPANPAALNPIVTTEGSLPRNIGATAANLLPLAIDPGMEGIGNSMIGRIAGAAKSAVPMSTTEAGGMLNRIEQAAENVPVKTSAPLAIAQKAQQYADTGATMPKVLTQFLERARPTTATPEGELSTSEGQILYPEARRFAENAGRLSASENMAANKQMQRLTTQFTKALGSANRAAAEEVGMGEQYDTAMRAYRNASNLQQFKNNIVKYGGHVALGALGLGAAETMWKALSK